MSFQGQFTAGFSSPIVGTQGDIQAVFDVLFCAWARLKIDLTTISSRKWEDSITLRFYRAIIGEKTSRKKLGYQFSFDFTLFPKVFDEVQDFDDLPDFGIPDIQITYRSDEADRYILEAKLLNKSDEYLHVDYVAKGMMRFIMGKYGSNVHWGGMMGYVLDRNTNKAKELVMTRIESERPVLGMPPQETLKISSLRDDVYETSHTRHTNTPFTIYHIFLPVN